MAPVWRPAGSGLDSASAPTSLPSESGSSDGGANSVMSASRSAGMASCISLAATIDSWMARRRSAGSAIEVCSGASIPVGFTSSRWGSLASFGARAQPGTKKWYGTTGNSFVAGVEFGDRVRAKAVTAGGESGDPKSPHFNDQAERYASGNLRDVYFYPDDLKGHTARTYHPGK